MTRSRPTVDEYICIYRGTHRCNDVECEITVWLREREIVGGNRDGDEGMLSCLIVCMCGGVRCAAC